MVKNPVSQLDSLDRWIFGAAALVFLLSVTLIQNDKLLFGLAGETASTGESIAVLHRKNNDVRRRYETDTAFVPVADHEDMFQNDSVFTGDGSDAELEFADKSRITLESGSLVVIQATKAGGSRLALQRGMVSGSLASGQAMTIVGANGQETVMKANGDAESAKVQLGVSDKGTLQVTVLEGKADVKNETGEITLDQNQAASINSTVLERVQYSIQLESPAPNQAIYQNAQAPIEFAWINLDPASRPQFKLEVSRDPQFKSLEFQTQASSEKVAVRTLAGTGAFFWRVKAIAPGSREEDAKLSPAQKFVVSTESAPRLASPADEHEFPFVAKDGNTGARVALTWAPGSSAEPVDAHYEIELYKGNRTALLQKITSETAATETPALSDGTYFWRVRVTDSARPNALWSPVRSFRVKESAPQGPVLAAPFNGQKLMKKDGDLEVSFLWKLPQAPVGSSNDGAKFEVELSSDPSFAEDKILDSDSVSRGEWSWDAEKFGTYYWRVRAELADGSKTLASQTGSFEVAPWEAASAPELRAQSLGFNKRSLDEGKLPEIQWKRSNTALSYEIEVAEDAEFSDSLFKERTKEPALTWPKGEIPGEGETVRYGRVRSETGKNEYSAWSKAVPLKLSWRETSLGTPSAVAPRGGQVIEVARGEKAPPLAFEWRPVEEGETYSVQIATDTAFTDIVGEEDLKDLRYETSDLPLGKLFWRVKAKNRYAESTWAGPYAFTRTDVIVQPKALAAPTLLAPLGRVFKIEDTDEVAFKWDPVEKAKEYELVVIFKPTTAEAGATTPPKPYPVKRLRTSRTSINLPLASEGSYTFEVKAYDRAHTTPLTQQDQSWSAIDPGGSRGLASIASADTGTGPQETSKDALSSAAKFEVLRHQLDQKRPGFIAFGTWLAPYQYRAFVPGQGNGLAQSAAMTVSLSGEYWWRPRWGAGFQYDVTAFTIDSRSFTRNSVQAVVKHRVQFQEINGWHLAPFAGLEARQYFLQTNLSVDRFWAPGLVAGFDMRKTLTDRLSLGIKAQYFQPLLTTGIATGGSLAFEPLSFRNFSVGVQGFYWLSNRIGLGAGAFLENRSIGFKADNTPTDTTRISIDGSYFYGSAVYRFGK